MPRNLPSSVGPWCHPSCVKRRRGPVDRHRVVVHCRTIDASAGAIFTILADARRHHELDGSGLLRGLSEPSTPRLAMGAVFEMRMRQAGTPYRIENRVVEFDEPNLIAWEVHPAGRLTGLRDRLFGGHRWRYRLTPDGDRTSVCEEWDHTGARSPWLLHLLRFPSRNSRAIERTLDRLAELATEHR